MISRSFKRFLVNSWEVVEIIVIAFVTVFLVRTFIAQPFLVNGASMEPNYSDGNYLLVDELSYYFEAPHRGDVIVLRYPGNDKTFFIKRVVGLPGELITITNGLVAVSASSTPNEATVIKESYLPTGTVTTGDQEILLGDEEYFVMGDNRTNSFDSRNWGPLPKDHIIGLVRLRIFPLNRFGIIKTPEL